MELHLDQHLFWCISLLVLLNANTTNEHDVHLLTIFIICLLHSKEEETSVEEVW